MMLGKWHSEKYNFFSFYCLESVDNSQRWTKESQWITYVSKVPAKLPSALDFFFIAEIRCQFTLKFRVLTNAFLLTRLLLFYSICKAGAGQQVVSRAPDAPEGCDLRGKDLISTGQLHPAHRSESHAAISMKNLPVLLFTTVKWRHHLTCCTLPSYPPSCPDSQLIPSICSREGMIIMTLHLEVQVEVGAPPQCILFQLRDAVSASAELLLISALRSPKVLRQKKDFNLLFIIVLEKGLQYFQIVLTAPSCHP